LSAAKKKEYEAFCAVRQLLFLPCFFKQSPHISSQPVDLLQQFAGRRTIAKPVQGCKGKDPLFAITAQMNVSCRTDHD
jgi:hypothetical protein